jgi:hypothetical protein
MLDDGQQDDQVGLAAFVNAHPSLITMDMDARIIRNVTWLEQVSPRDLGGEAAFFAHFPGAKDWASLVPYTQTIKATAGTFSLPVLDLPGQKHPIKAAAVGVLLLLLLLAFWLGQWTRRAR